MNTYFNKDSSVYILMFCFHFYFIQKTSISLAAVFVLTNLKSSLTFHSGNMSQIYLTLRLYYTPVATCPLETSRQ